MPNQKPSTRRPVVPAMLVPVVLLLAMMAAHSPASAHAGNATLRATLNAWSRTVAVDAHSVALAAQRRHPRRMTFSARRFHADALHARAAIARQHPTTASGRRARKLALAAYTDFGRAGSGWAAAGNARLAHNLTAAKRAASSAASTASAGSKLLVAAGKLLR
jgi:hypothetical protein